MSAVKVAIINNSSLDDADVKRVIPALQKQVHQDFAKAWGIDADLHFVGKRESVRSKAKGAWWLVVLDTTDQAGQDGYHDLTNDGWPLAKVFVKTAKQLGMPWSLALSHELLEMLADPDINLAGTRTRPTGGMLIYGHEICDPCQSPKYSYTLKGKKFKGIRLSDFLYPAWYEQFRKGHAKQRFDHMGHIRKPFGILPLGYISVHGRSGGWRLLLSDEKTVPHSDRVHAGSRRERRHTLRDTWRKSRVKR